MDETTRQRLEEHLRAVNEIVTADLNDPHGSDATKLVLENLPEEVYRELGFQQQRYYRNHATRMGSLLFTSTLPADRASVFTLLAKSLLQAIASGDEVQIRWGWRMLKGFAYSSSRPAADGSYDSGIVDESTIALVAFALERGLHALKQAQSNKTPSGQRSPHPADELPTEQLITELHEWFEKMRKETETDLAL